MKLLIVLVVIIIIIIVIKNNNKETFDAKIKDNIKIENCGSVCTEVIGCSAFAYDPKTKKCYLTKDPIVNNEPERGIYIDEFNSEQVICNKLVPIPENTDNVLTENKRFNMFYTCLNSTKDKCSRQYDTYKIVNDTMTKIDNKAIKTIMYEPYEVRDIIWPINKNDLKYNKTYSEKKFIFEKKEKEYVGDYLYPHKCTTNISEKKCIDACYKNEDCTGTEWSPIYLNDNDEGGQDMRTDVCCPMKKINKTQDRRDSVKYGKYYEKKEVTTDLNGVFIKI